MVVVNSDSMNGTTPADGSLSFVQFVLRGPNRRFSGFTAECRISLSPIQPPAVPNSLEWLGQQQVLASWVSERENPSLSAGRLSCEFAFAPGAKFDGYRRMPQVTPKKAHKLVVVVLKCLHSRKDPIVRNLHTRNCKSPGAQGRI